MKKSKKIYYGSNVIQTGSDPYQEIFTMSNPTGRGTLVMHHVFPGVDIIFNEFNMKECLSEFRSDIRLLSFDYCLEGRIEWEIGGNRYCYLQPGSLETDTKRTHAEKFGLPLSYYRGFTVAIAVDAVEENDRELLLSFGVDVEKLYDKFYREDLPYITMADSYIKTLFQTVDSADHNNNHDYLKIKVMEFLLYMQNMDMTHSVQKDYFPKHQVDIIKKIEKLMTENYAVHYTVRQLSQMHGIAETSLKSCFKGVFGKPAGAYMKEYRINIASGLLKDTDKSIMDIAGELGYDNQSKFAAAFRSQKGISPREYRKIKK